MNSVAITLRVMSLDLRHSKYGAGIPFQQPLAMQSPAGRRSDTDVKEGGIVSRSETATF